MSGEPLTLSFNQLKTYLASKYTLFQGYVGSRNWTMCNSILDGVITEVTNFMTANPNHNKVKTDAQGNSKAGDLVIECQMLKLDIADIIVYINNNSQTSDFQITYDDLVEHLQERLNLLAQSFSS